MSLILNVNQLIWPKIIVTRSLFLCIIPFIFVSLHKEVEFSNQVFEFTVVRSTCSKSLKSCWLNFFFFFTGASLFLINWPIWNLNSLDRFEFEAFEFWTGNSSKRENLSFTTWFYSINQTSNSLDDAVILRSSNPP